MSAHVPSELRRQVRDRFAWNEDASIVIASTPIGRATVAALRMNRPQMLRVRRLWAAMGEHPPDFE